MADQTKARNPLGLVPLPVIQRRILVVRGRHVMLDQDLAELYGVQTGRLVQQVKRNIDRFPPDFMFQHRACTALRQLISPPRKSKRPVGFRLPEGDP